MFTINQTYVISLFFVFKWVIWYQNITHIIVNFIDDSTNIIGFKNHEMIKTYLEQYYKSLSKFYNINKLKLNNDKNPHEALALPLVGSFS